MRFYDILSVLAIFGIFFGIQLFNIVAVGKKNIEKNWPKHRCNPMIMPFAGMFGHNTSENFTYCVQNMQTSYMSEILKPINHSLDMSNMLTGNLGESIQKIREVINQSRTFGSSIFTKIFGVFFNALIQLQFVTIKIKSLFAKTIGVGTSFFYLIDGANMTGQSVWRGPVGGLLRTLCFDPETNLRLKDGSVKKMNEIKINDILENNSKVTGVVQLKNIFNENFYEIYDKQYGENIYVTGHHLIRDEETGRFIHVENHKDAKKSNKNKDMFWCLITDDHLIKIGEYTFWDYEDDSVLI